MPKVIKIKPSPFDEEWRREIIKLIDSAEHEIVIIDGGGMFLGRNRKRG